jgi:phosphoglycerate dehydrogenase-like enzyme
MSKYQVIRTHVSPYQSKDFLQTEAELIREIGSLNYRTLENFEPVDTILITNTHTQLKQLPPSLLKHTKLIVHPNSGYDHFTPEHDLWKNIPMVIGHTIRAQAVAEYSIGALFEGLLELPQHITWNKERTWNRTLLKGTEVWVFGYGHIGKVIADTLSALGMKVTKIDPFKEDCLPHWSNANLKSAKVIISAMSLNETTKHYFGKKFFAELGEEVLFINGARGKLVDEVALKEFLLTHPQSFAFLDVFEKEPFGEDWHGFPQVWKTSHIAGVEKDLDKKILEFEKFVLEDYLKLSEADFMRKYEKELLQKKWIKGILI